jgi:hypothetical protein
MDRIKLDKADGIRAACELLILKWDDAADLSMAEKIDAVMDALAAYRRLSLVCDEVQSKRFDRHAEQLIMKGEST